MSSKNLERWFPRLKGPIESLFEPWGPLASRRVSERLRRHVEFHIQGVSIEASGPCATNTEPGLKSDCLCQLEFDRIEDPWSLRLDRASVYQMIDGLLGSTASDPDEANLPMSDIDWRVAKMALEDLIEPCVGLWFCGDSGDSGDSDRVGRKPQAKLLGESELAGCRLAQVRIDFQVRLSVMASESPKSVGQLDSPQTGDPGSDDASHVGRVEHLGHGAWFFPESLLVDQLGRLLFGNAMAADLSVVLATSRIGSSELSQLEVGDIIATEQIADGQVEVQSLAGLLYRAEAGVFRGQRAVRLTGVQPDRSQIL